MKILYIMMLSCFLCACGAKHNEGLVSDITVSGEPRSSRIMNTTVENNSAQESVSTEETYSISVNNENSFNDFSKESYSNEPAELGELLNMKADLTAKETTSVSQLRPQAIKEVAQLVAIQTAMKWRYEILLKETNRYNYLLDNAFNFTPLLMTNGEALVMPPVLTRSGASFRIEKDELATSANTTYEMLSTAKYVSVTPNWRVYLMVDAFPEPEKPNPAVLPRNGEELAIWRKAIREAWLQGIEQANDLYITNISRLVRDYKGVMLYHILTAKNMLTSVQTASTEPVTNINDKKMFLQQKVFRITAPSRFTAPEQEKK